MTSIRLTPAERQALIDYFRRSADPAVGHRAHILLLLDTEQPWATISAVLFCSFATVSRWKRRFEAERPRSVVVRGDGRSPPGGLPGGGRSGDSPPMADHHSPNRSNELL